MNTRSWFFFGLLTLVVAGIAIIFRQKSSPQVAAISPPCTWSNVFNPRARGLRWAELAGTDIDNWSVLGYKDQAKPIARGKWVGVVERLGNGGPSRLFPKLKKDDYGCIWFKVDYATPEATAEFRSGGVTHGFPNAMYCAFRLKQDGSNEHGDDTPPKSVPSNDHCAQYDTVIVSFHDTAQKPISVRFIYGGPTDTIQQNLRDSLATRALPLLNIQTLVQRVVAGPGLWFPCTATGCCRVFGA